MSSYNHVTLEGFLDADPVVKTYASKPSRATFVLNVERFGKASLGSKGRETFVDNFNIVCAGRLAEVVGSYMSKGKRCLIDGHIRIRSFIEAGERQWVTEIEAQNLKFISAKPESEVVNYL